MRLSRIYSNLPNLFEPIDFVDGLNVILGEIRDPNNQEKDTHNLGKTTLSKLINFCLLSGQQNEPSFFLKKHKEFFRDFVFYLEIKYGPKQFLTIRRSVECPTKISLKKHVFGGQDFSETPLAEFEHSDIGFDKSKELVDAILNLKDIAPFDFRDALGYALRVQNDYHDVFRLQKNSRAKDVYWKPYLAKILGFDQELLEKKYHIDSELETKLSEETRLKSELIGFADEMDKLEGILLVKTEEARKFEHEIDVYNFEVSDTEINKELVEKIESQVSNFNERRYILSKQKKRVEDSLIDKVSFNPEEAKKLFNEASIYFEGQIKKDFDELIKFNKTITKEREQYLQDELCEIEEELEYISSELHKLNNQRAYALKTLRNKETFSKYKDVTAKLVELKAEITDLERKRHFLENLNRIQKDIAALKVEKDETKLKLEEVIKQGNSRYHNIRLFFSEIVKSTINKDAYLYTKTNKEGNLEFFAQFLDNSGAETSESDGHTYKKLLCMAFDLSIAREYADKEFIHFLYHDGIFESLDDRKKIQLIELAREYTENYNIQYIITAIDSELPFLPKEKKRFSFDTNEIVKVLHDAGSDGLLFKMSSW